MLYLYTILLCLHAIMSSLPPVLFICKTLGERETKSKPFSTLTDSVLIEFLHVVVTTWFLYVKLLKEYMLAHVLTIRSTFTCVTSSAI